MSLQVLLGAAGIGIGALLGKALWTRSLRAAVTRRTEDLRNELALHAATLEATTEGLLVTDASGRIARYNQRFIEMWGFPPNLWSNPDFEQWLAWGSAQTVEPESSSETYHAAAASDIHHAALITLKDGRTFERHSLPQVVDGRTVGRVFSYRDITDRVRAEDERRRLEAHIQQVQKLESLGVLAGGIAHDFNNLLVGILGQASMGAAETPPCSPLAFRLEQIERAAQRAAELTSQMLAYSGRGTFVRQRADLSTIVEEMANLIRTAVSKKATLDLRLARGVAVFDGDPAQMGQVILNLVTNASDALGEGAGAIVVSTGRVHVSREDLRTAALGAELPEGEYAYVEVRDDGSGMSAETLQRIFDPFFTTKFTGRGLGLAAVLGIVRSHNGAITIRSTPGAGTTFRVLLPFSAAPERTVAAAAAAPTSAAPARRGGRVLVVDDEPGVRLIASEALKRAGFEVEIAEDGEQALDSVRRTSRPFDAVLLDMTMPKTTGVDVFHELRTLQPELPIVLTSGYSEQDATERLGGDRSSGFIQKPFLPKALVRVMQDALRHADIGESA